MEDAREAYLRRREGTSPHRHGSFFALLGGMEEGEKKNPARCLGICAHVKKYREDALHPDTYERSIERVFPLRGVFFGRSFGRVRMQYCAPPFFCGSCNVYVRRRITRLGKLPTTPAHAQLTLQTDFFFSLSRLTFFLLPLCLSVLRRASMITAAKKVLNVSIASRVVSASCESRVVDNLASWLSRAIINS